MNRLIQILNDYWFVLVETLCHPRREVFLPSSKQQQRIYSRKHIELSSLRGEINISLNKDTRIDALEKRVIELSKNIDELEKNSNSHKKLSGNFKLLLWLLGGAALIAFGCSLYLSNDLTLNSKQEEIYDFCKVVYKSTFFSFLGLIGGKVVP